MRSQAATSLGCFIVCVIVMVLPQEKLGYHKIWGFFRGGANPAGHGTRPGVAFSFLHPFAPHGHCCSLSAAGSGEQLTHTGDVT